jgi:formyltetrahydrofolate-dependent phosphoribosylglycinamide formyltransferase
MPLPYTLPRVGSGNEPLRIAVFISGGGSGLAALLKFQAETPRLHNTVLVISEDPNAGGQVFCEENDVTFVGIRLPNISDKSLRRLSHEEEIEVKLVEYDVELIVLSGYMRILTPNFVKKWKGRLVNIHPSLLPKYPGAHAHRDALADGATVSGCTVHLVDEGVDSGQILASEMVEVLPTDSLSDLQNRIKIIEHKLYPQIIDDLCSGKIQF